MSTHQYYRSHSLGIFGIVSFVQGTTRHLKTFPCQWWTTKTHSNIFPEEESFSLCILLRDKKNLFSWNYWENKTAHWTELLFLRARSLPLLCWPSWIPVRRHILQSCSKTTLFLLLCLLCFAKTPLPKLSDLDTGLEFTWISISGRGTEDKAEERHRNKGWKELERDVVPKNCHRCYALNFRPQGLVYWAVPLGGANPAWSPLL